MPTPFLELKVQPAYPSPVNVVIQYRFSAEEEKLRCRYVVSKAGKEIGAGETQPLAPGVWYEQQLDVSEQGDGSYSFRLVVQAQRGNDFVDLAFLDKTADFVVDQVPPSGAPVHDHTDILLDGYHVYLDLSDWTDPEGSPISIYYTLDGSQPNQSSNLYSRSTGIVVPLAGFNLPLRAAAYDLAGNPSPGELNMPVYTDVASPAQPDVSLDDTPRYVGSKAVTLSHPEWTAPAGSPVKVYYTTNGSDPLTSGTLYDGNPIPISGDIELTTLKVAAKDEVGNQSSIKQMNYRFMKIQSVDPTFSPKGQVVITLNGFGFGTVSPVKNQDVNLFDSKGTKVVTFFDMNVTATSIAFFVDMNLITYGIVVSDALVPGWIEVTIHDPDPFTDSIPFLITP